MRRDMHDVATVRLGISIMPVMPGRMLMMIRRFLMVIELNSMRVLDIVHMGQSVVPSRQRKHAQKRQYSEKREDSHSETGR